MVGFHRALRASAGPAMPGCGQQNPAMSSGPGCDGAPTRFVRWQMQLQAGPSLPRLTRWEGIHGLLGVVDRRRTYELAVNTRKRDLPTIVSPPRQI